MVHVHRRISLVSVPDVCAHRRSKMPVVQKSSFVSALFLVSRAIWYLSVCVCVYACVCVCECVCVCAHASVSV